MIHANDKQNRKKHAKMNARLSRGVLVGHEKNTGRPKTSKVNPEFGGDMSEAKP